MQSGLIIALFMLALLAVFLLGWAVCTAAVAAYAWLNNQDIEEAIAPWLAEL